MRRNRLLALAILLILGVAALAPAGGQADSQARAEAQAQRALKKAERAALAEGKRQQREAEKAARKLAHKEQQVRNQEQRKAAARARAVKETEHAVVTITCTSVSVTFHGFPEVAGSPQEVIQKLVYKQRPVPALSYVYAPPIFHFEGAGATEEFKIAAPLGESIIAVRAHFSGNGVKGSFNIRELLTCGPNSQFSLTTSQSLGGPFTTSQLAGEAGQTVDYQTTARNEGNTPLHFDSFSAPGCDDTPSGGTVGEVAVQPRETVSWYCHHTLTEVDHQHGAFANAASVTATPEFDPTVTSLLETSAGVLVSPIGTAGSGVATGGKEITSASAPASAAPSKSGVLAFSSAAVPSLHGPGKCIHGAFTVSVKSASVANVIFYLDGRKLARRTAHSARAGLISLRVNGAKLKAGTHRLKATITMVPGSPTAKAIVASRARVVRRCHTVKHA